MSEDSAIVEGTQEEATSEGSTKQSGQPSSAAEAITVEQFRDLQRQIATLSKTLQSGKDRAVKQTNERLDVLEKDVREVLQNAKASGQSVEDLLQEFEYAEELETRNMLRDMAKAFHEGRFPKTSSGQEQADGVDVSEVVSDLALDVSDTRVQAFQARKFASIDEAWREAAKLQKSILTTKPSDADRPSDVAGHPVSASKAQELDQEYREGAKNLRGMPLIRFKQKMRDKGWQGS